MSEIEHRIAKAEWRLDTHDDTLRDLQNSTEDFRQSLHAIQSTLSQIKWFAMGATAIYMADYMGLDALVQFFRP